ncbi:Concanavalin A-like lectin/glucanases superfamily protein [Streptomyces sp. yr375]|uniref:LamG-like jellyroll fold domain-containing protein n=1 Tax=Streptomyces sp. yr375 TaxID=1761906 RepID=UPI0008B883D7|nr:Concanavalin A-like lectin/glucanases superfamily protein [Streptomyces sp. yr375]
MPRRHTADVERAAAPRPTPARRRRSVALLAGLSLLAVAGATLGTAVPAQADITDGLVLRYKLDETSGTVVHDTSGQGHNGTVNGTAAWKGAEGLGFNGTNTYVKVPDNIMAGLNSITVDFDVWIDPTMDKPSFLYGFGNSSAGNGYLFSTGNQFRAGITSADFHTEQQTRPGTSYQLARGMWKHVSYTQTGTTGVLYENGVEKARNTNVTITPASIGNRTTAADYIGRSLYAAQPDTLLSFPPFSHGVFRLCHLFTTCSSAASSLPLIRQRTDERERFMRLISRTGLAALAVAGAALMAGATPALADGTPTSMPSVAPTADPGTDVTPSATSPAPAPTPATDADTGPTVAPSQVAAVPRGGADTGVAEPSDNNNGAVLGGGAVAAFAAAGTVFYVVRRRRATGA